MMRIGLVWIDGQNQSIDSFCLLELTGLMMLAGEYQCFGNRFHRCILGSPWRKPRRIDFPLACAAGSLRAPLLPHVADHFFQAARETAFIAQWRLAHPISQGRAQ